MIVAVSCRNGRYGCEPDVYGTLGHNFLAFLQTLKNLHPEPVVASGPDFALLKALPVKPDEYAAHTLLLDYAAQRQGNHLPVRGRDQPYLAEAARNQRASVRQLEADAQVTILRTKGAA